MPRKKAKMVAINQEDLYKHFKELYVINITKTNITDETQSNTYVDFLDKDITMEELRYAVFSQKNNKSNGRDGIIAEIYKGRFDLISPFLLLLYNRVFRSGEYPYAWGEGIIAPIFIGGDDTKAKTYRGVTLINIIAKIYSQLLTD